MTKHTTDGVYLVEPDKHFPYQDDRFSSIVLQIIWALKPDGYINLGDALDWFQLSEYDKDPRRVNKIEEDLALYSDYLDEVAIALPKGSVVHQLEGNHEDRLRRYVWRRAGAIVNLVSSVPKELGFPERNAEGRHRWIWHPIDNWKGCQIGNTVIHHGHYFNKHTAVNNLDKYRGVNILHGHTHRVQYAHNGDYWAATLGHGSLADKTAHAPTPSDWQQAIGVLTVFKGKGSLEIVTVDNGVCHFRGKIYKG